MVRVVVGDEEELAQERLAGAVRDRGEQIRGTDQLDQCFPLREERLAQAARFAQLERIVYWLPERAAASEAES